MTTYTENCSRSIAEAPLGVWESLLQIFRTWMSDQQLRFKLRQERRQLAEMSDALLHDIGVSRVDAEREAARQDIPASRMLP